MLRDESAIIVMQRSSRVKHSETRGVSGSTDHGRGHRATCGAAMTLDAPTKFGLLAVLKSIAAQEN